MYINKDCKATLTHNTNGIAVVFSVVGQAAIFARRSRCVGLVVLLENLKSKVGHIGDFAFRRLSFDNWRYSDFSIKDFAAAASLVDASNSKESMLAVAGRDDTVQQ